MKCSLWIEDGITQVVLTPETKAEKAALETVREASSFNVKRGTFYECRGGWVRGSVYQQLHGVPVDDAVSTILVLDSRPKAEG